ncbi:34127_t:CDS:1, partial [Racocetra persica]
GKRTLSINLSPTRYNYKLEFQIRVQFLKIMGFWDKGQIPKVCDISLD